MVFGLPAAVGASILRHRLYDIDVVINRTLVYGALTATLGATYLGLVLLVGARPSAESTVGDRGLDARGGGAVPPGARAHPGARSTAASTAAATTPAQTLEAFGARLRDELDLDALRGETCASVVGETVQPAHVSLWLRGER